MNHGCIDSRSRSSNSFKAVASDDASTAQIITPVAPPPSTTYTLSLPSVENYPVSKRVVTMETDDLAFPALDDIGAQTNEAVAKAAADASTAASQFAGSALESLSDLGSSASDSASQITSSLSKATGDLTGVVDGVVGEASGAISIAASQVTSVATEVQGSVLKAVSTVSQTVGEVSLMIEDSPCNTCCPS